MKCVSYTRTTICAYEKNTPTDVIKQQNERIRHYIKAQGWQLVAKYSDRKNDPESRTSFDEMRMDGIARKFDILIVDSIFRCGNNFSAAKDLLLKVFFPAGIHFAVVEDGVCSVNMSKEQIETYLKEKQNIYQGHFAVIQSRKRYADGYLEFYDAKYGYRLNADKSGFLIDEKAAEVVKEIFRMRLLGKTYREIVAALNEKGVDTPSAHRYKTTNKEHKYRTKWDTKQITAILHQTAYIGYFTKKIAGEDFELRFPVIIEKKAFEEVQKQTENRHSQKGAGKAVKHIFSGRLINGDTGTPMHSYKHNELEGNPRRYHINNSMAGPWIAYETIYNAMRDAILRECGLASKVKALMAASAGGTAREKEKQHFSLQARNLCMEMSHLIEADIQAYVQYEAKEIELAEYQQLHEKYQETLQSKEQQYTSVMQSYEEMMKVLSDKNPWIERFAVKNIPLEMSQKDVASWVKVIRVFHFEKVIVELQEQEWRDRLPVEWREGFNGA